MADGGDENESDQLRRHSFADAALALRHSNQTADAGRRSWAPALGTARAAEVRTVALEVAARIADRGRLEQALDLAPRQSQFPNVMHWQPYGIAQGDAGLALFCGYLDAAQPDHDWDRAGHGFLQAAVADFEAAGGRIAPGAFSGLAGLVFAAWSLSRRGERYRALLTSLEDALVIEALTTASTTAHHAGGGGVWQFDVISGLAGIGAYLLQRRSRPVVADALDAVLRALIHLTAPNPGGRPRWYTSPQMMADEPTARHYPHGNLNLGLAHGIPGPLALMALAYKEGVELPGLRESIQHIAGFIADSRIDGPYGVDWPTAIPLQADGTWNVASAFERSRTAWCYGSPGVARSVWIAGDALGDGSLKALAVEAMEAVLRRPIPERMIDSPTLCHGVSGLLAIVLRFARDDDRAGTFAGGADALCQQLLDLYAPERPLGYCSIEPGGNRVDQAGLLDGAPGVALALLAAATPSEPFWDRLFLLS
jgi:lantibiotic modifying enzyme